MNKKIFAIIMTLAVLFSLFAGCKTEDKGSTPSESKGEASTSQGSEGEEASGQGLSTDPVTINIYQFKVEFVDAFERAIKAYEEEFPNVTVNLETIGGGGDYAGTLKVKMQSDEQPDIFNVGGLQETMNYLHMLEDLSDQPWVEHAVDGVLLDSTIDGSVYGLPFAIEGYGFVYNKNIFAAAGIDVDSLTTYDAIEAAVKDLDARIVAGEFAEEFPLLEAAFEFPAMELWVSGEHTANVIMQAELKDPVTTLNTPEIEFSFGDAYKKLIDIQTLYSASRENRSLLNAVDYSTQVGGGLAIERVAMIQQGNWIMPEVLNVDPEIAENLGMLPLPVAGYVEDSITTGVPQYWVVNKESDPAVVEQSKHFLNWIYQSEKGKEFVVNEFMFIPPFTNYEGLEPKDALAREVKRYADQGKIIPWVLRSFPSTWGMSYAGDAVQRYLADQITWEELEQICIDGWAELRKG